MMFSFSRQPRWAWVAWASWATVACSSPSEQPATTTPNAAPAPTEMPGQALFAANCALCHGPDGKRGLNGAHDLTKSNLTQAGRVYMITNGLGNMPAFKNQLSAAQIEEIAAYSLTLK